jgi:quinol monooxygenase YgiN
VYGLISKIITQAGRRDELANILIEGSTELPGCLSYVVATDLAEPDSLWVTEIWNDKASHQASLTLPSVQAAIAQGRPLIAGFGERIETSPLGGFGLK